MWALLTSATITSLSDTDIPQIYHKTTGGKNKTNLSVFLPY